MATSQVKFQYPSSRVILPDGQNISVTMVSLRRMSFNTPVVG